MAEWLGHLLANAPVWIVIIVALVAGVVAAFFYLMPFGLEIKGPKSEWQKSWYKSKDMKHGKK